MTASMSSVEPDQNESDLMAMVEEIGTAVATGLIPVVGQAINVVDTIQSLLALHNSQGAEAQAEAKFDLVLALVGWIPGAGGGVKKTIRIVNKNPARYAPILFDVLRMVCLKLGIQTSPESLLDKLFDAAGLKAVLGKAQSSVENSWPYQRLPSEVQQIVSSTMATVRASLPAMLLLVTTKLMHWKRMQRNTAARSTGAIRKSASARKPAAKHPTTAQKGANTPSHVPGNTAGNSVIGTAPLGTVTNEVIGILGEHITDYFLYEEYGWGKHWNSHDKGVAGSWESKPGKNFPGKLNEGTKLNALFAVKAHGVGIDGVWKVQLGDPHNNCKPYAIVESKASSHSTAPADASRKPSVRGKLLSNARRIKKAAAAAAATAAATLPKTADLLDPPTGGAVGETPLKSSRGQTGARATGATNAQRSRQKPLNNSATAQPAVTAAGKTSLVLVQMSRQWIAKNIGSAVKDPRIALDIMNNHMHVYSRHLFYTPFYLPSAAKHLFALQAKIGSAGTGHDTHQDHSIPSTHCHDEEDVKMAVNSKLKALKMKLEP